MTDALSVADLAAIADELAAVPQFINLRRKLTTVSTAQSCLADLRQAADTVTALEELLASPRKKGTKTRAATEHALLMHAITLYARATHTQAKQGERGPITVKSKLSDSQLDDHETILNIRNRAYSHVYSGEEIGGEIWHRSVIFLVEEHPGRWRPGSVSQRLELDRKMLARLKRQLPIASSIILENFRRKLDNLMADLSAYPALSEVISRHLVDPERFFGGPRGLELAIQGLAGGEMSGRGPVPPKS